MPSYDHIMNRLGKQPQATIDEEPDFELDP